MLDGNVVQTFDPNAPYFVSLNLLAWVVGEIYDLPWQQGSSGSVPVVIEKAEAGHGDIPCMNNILTSPIDVLSMMSMPRELFTHHQYMLLHECLQRYMDVRPHTDDRKLMLPLRVRTMGFGSMYHMYLATQEELPYDNMSGSRLGASLWAAGMAINAGLNCCAPNLEKRPEYKDPKKPSRYKNIEDQKERDLYGIEWSDLVESLRDAPRAGWVSRCMTASIGHIVIGWAAHMVKIGHLWAKSTDL